jgi:hypothetical protein
LLGLYEFAKRGEAPVMGLVKLDGITEAELKRPRKPVLEESEPQNPEDTIKQTVS